MTAFSPAFPLALRRAFCLLFSSKALRILVAGLSIAASLHAQSSRQGLVVQAVDESDRVTLVGSTHPLATPAADRGAVPASMPADRLLLLLRRSPEQERELRILIESLHDRNSANFHKWLTPAQFGAQWGAADSDIAAVTAWLQSHGFQVKGPTTGRTAIEFSGTAGEIAEAFHAQIHLYEVNGEMHHANVADPQIPAALAPVVAGVSMLNDFRPHSMIRRGPHAVRGVYDAKNHKIRPELTDSSGFLFLGPADVATIYDSPIKALNPAATGATIDGAGAKIGIIGDSNIATASNANYRDIFGLKKLFDGTSPKKPIVIIDGGTDPGENGDAVEAYLDTEVANGVAPGATVYLYTAADSQLDYGLNLAMARAINDNIVDVLNMSFGACEAQLGYLGNQFYNSMWEQAAAQGISVTVSSGDSGSAACDDPNKESVAAYGLQVNGLASTPFNIAVGGTDFAVLAGPDGSGLDFNNYVSNTNDPTTLGSALGYIPEVPWNESIDNFPPGTIATTIQPLGSTIAAGGGGKSNCEQGYVKGDGSLYCVEGYPKPSWQAAPGVPADNYRDIPDVSFFASDGFYFALWGICTDQDVNGSGNPVPDCVPDSSGSFYIYPVGGTSASAPTFAGILALVKQATGERQGQADYVLYNLARNAAGSFHDVTTGNNSVPCSSGTANCVANPQGALYLTGYDAVAGYDLASGLGSVDISALISNWASAGLSTTSTKLTLTPATIEHGEVVTADAVVTGSGGTPTGDVALTASGNPPSHPLGSAIGTYALVSGGSTGNLKLNGLPGGKYNVVASYGGSPEFALSVSAPVPVTVTPEPSTTAVTLTAYDPLGGPVLTNGPVPYGYYLGFTAHPYGNHSPVVNGVVEPDAIATGTVAFLEGSVGLGSKTLSSSGYAVVNTQYFTGGSHTVYAKYSGDNSLEPSVGTLNVVIAKGVTELKLSAGATKYAGKPIVFTIKLSTVSSGAAPTGNVVLKSGSTILAEGKLEGVAASADAVAWGSATISTSNIPPGANDIVAVYLGDGNYAESTSNSVDVKGRPTFTLANTFFKLPGEHSTSSGGIVTKSVGGYAGTVEYTCVLVTKTKTSTPPECAMYPATETLTANGTATPQILIFGKGTKLPSGVTLGSNSNSRWLGAGGAVLAFCLMFGIPARRRGWRSMLAVILLLAVAAGFTACSSSFKMITAGEYVFKVTGKDSKDSTNTATATVKVEVL